MHKPIEYVTIKPLALLEDTGNDQTITELSFPIESDSPVPIAKASIKAQAGFMPDSKRSSESKARLAESGTTSSAASNTGMTSRLYNALATKANKLESRGSGVITIPTVADKKKLSKLLSLGRSCMFCSKVNVSQATFHNLYSKYEKSTQNTYNANIVNDLIINSNTHITAVFKDYLIFDDTTEILKGFYPRRESYDKILQLTKYYEKSSKVFPNYVAISEKKYLFKNIERKQKMINAKCENKPLNRYDSKGTPMITEGFIEGMSKKGVGLPAHAVAKMDMIDLVEKFIDRDSLSLINHSNCTNIELPFQVPSQTSTKGKKAAEPLKSKPMQKPKVFQVNNFMTATQGATSKAVHNTTKARHLSQEPPQGEQKKQSDGRISAAGYYRTYQGHEESRDTIDEGKPKAIPSIACLNMNPAVNQPRSITPQTCTAANAGKVQFQNKMRTDASGTMMPKPGIMPQKTLPPKQEKAGPTNSNKILSPNITASVRSKAVIAPSAHIPLNSNAYKPVIVKKQPTPTPISTRPVVTAKPFNTQPFSPQAAATNAKTTFPTPKRTPRPSQSKKPFQGEIIRTRAGSALGIGAKKEVVKGPCTNIKK